MRLKQWMGAMGAGVAGMVALAVQPAAAVTCYDVYDPQQQLVLRSSSAPVDLSIALDQALARQGLAGHHLVFYEAGFCDPLNQVPSLAAARPAPRPPTRARGRGLEETQAALALDQVSSVSLALDGVVQRNGIGMAAAEAVAPREQAYRQGWAQGLRSLREQGDRRPR